MHDIRRAHQRRDMENFDYVSKKRSVQLGLDSVRHFAIKINECTIDQELTNAPRRRRFVGTYERAALHSRHLGSTTFPPRTERSRSWKERSMNVRPTIITFTILKRTFIWRSHTIVHVRTFYERSVQDRERYDRLTNVH